MGSLSGRRIMVTSGGTREYIDDVRVVTNISTGALGAKIAEKLYSRGAEVFYVHGKQSYEPFLVATGIDGTARLSSHEFVTAKDLMETMKALIQGFKIDSVVHSAAVSDFTFRKRKDVKLDSNSKADFIKYLEQTITSTPKIIRYIKKWNPEITLVGFKFTVGLVLEEICRTACEALKKNKADLIVANDKKEMTRLGTHRAYLINSSEVIRVYSDAIKDIRGERDGSPFVVRDGKAAIARGIADFLDGSF